MGKTNLGRVSVAPRGAYNNETSYKRLDVVEYEGSSYLFLKDSTGIIPTADGEVTMLLAKRGKDFAYEDFTPEQLEALRGEKGDKGEPGKGFTILGYYGTFDLLKEAIPTPEAGDTYGIGTAVPYNIYVFDGVTNDWVDNGKLAGGGEGGGNVVLIPSAVMRLSNASTPNEVLAAFGGKENFMSICKRLKEGNAIGKVYEGGGNFSVGNVVIFHCVYCYDDDNADMWLRFENNTSVTQLATTMLKGQPVCFKKTYSYVKTKKVPNAIFDLTSESTSEQVLDAFEGIDGINAIFAGINDSDVSQNDLLIAENRYSGNGHSVLHNFGGSPINASQNNGFHRMIYFAYTSIEPTIEVTQWVIKYNYTTAACEVTKKEIIDSSNLVSDPTVGGVDKPASAEAVRIVNDKMNNTDIITLSNLVKHLDKDCNHEWIIFSFDGQDNFRSLAERITKGNVIIYFSSYGELNTVALDSHARFEDESNFSIGLMWLGVYEGRGLAAYYLNVACIDGLNSVEVRSSYYIKATIER